MELIVAGVTSEEYDRLADVELAAAETIVDPGEKKRRLNQASALATLAELARERAEQLGQANLHGRSD